MFDYGNFLASCPGDTEAGLSPKFQAHFLMSCWLELILCAQPLHIVSNQYQEFCGQKKDDWYDPILTVSPLDPHCAEYFRYTAAGEILPTTNTPKQTAAQTTIERLGLNHSKLDRGRRKAIDALFQIIASSPDADLTTRLEGFNQPDFEGKLIPYCAAVTYQLQQLLP